MGYDRQGIKRSKEKVKSKKIIALQG